MVINRTLFRTAFFSFSLMFTFCTAKCADEPVKSAEANEAIVILTSLQELSMQYPKAKLKIECKVLHSSDPLNANREVSHRILIDEPRFLCISTDSRPGQTNLPYQRESVSFDGKMLRMMPMHVEASGKVNMAADEESATGSRQELAAAHPLDLGDMIPLELLGYSNYSTSTLTVGLLSYRDYLAQLIQMANQGERFRSAYTKADAGSNMANVLVIATAPDATLKKGRHAVRHELHISPLHHRPVKMVTIIASRPGHLLDNAEQDLRETTVQWKELESGTFLPEQIQHREEMKGQLTYEETTTVIAEKVFGPEPIPDDEFGWVQLEPEAGQMAMFPGDEMLRLWDGKAFVHGNSEADAAHIIPGNSNWFGSWWFLANLIVSCVAMLVLARRVFRRST